MYESLVTELTVGNMEVATGQKGDSISIRTEAGHKDNMTV